MAENVITIEGPIGAGKSTLIRHIDKMGLYHTIEEFIDPFWLKQFYKNRKDNTEDFEISTLLGRKARHKDSRDSEGTFFFDRSLIGGREIFVQNSFDEGYLTHEGLDEYDSRLKKALDQFGRTAEEYTRWGEKLLVYLDAPPEVCHARQKKRETPGEMIPLDYMKRLDQYYKRFVANVSDTYVRKWGLPSAPNVLIIDATRDIEKDERYLHETAENIIQKVKQINEK